MQEKLRQYNIALIREQNMQTPTPHTKIHLRVEKTSPEKKENIFTTIKTSVRKVPTVIKNIAQKVKPLKSASVNKGPIVAAPASIEEGPVKLKVISPKPKWFSQWQLSLGRSLTELRRNILRSLAIVFIISLVLSTLSVAIMVSFITEQGIQIINNKIDLNIEIQDNVSLDQINPLIQEIQVLPYITKVTYISKNQALEDFRHAHPDLPDFLSTYNISNPLPASLRISLTDPKKYADLINFLDKKQNTSLINIAKARDNYTNRDRIEQLISITDTVKSFLYFFVTIFAAIGVLIIISTVQLSLNSRKRELSIMQVVGASYKRILMPFATEAIVLSSISTIIALIFLWSIGQKLSPLAVQYFGTEAASIIAFIKLNFFSITILFILISFAITLVTTWLTVWKYLTSQKLF